MTQKRRVQQDGKGKASYPLKGMQLQKVTVGSVKSKTTPVRAVGSVVREQTPPANLLQLLNQVTVFSGTGKLLQTLDFTHREGVSKSENIYGKSVPLIDSQSLFFFPPSPSLSLPLLGVDKLFMVCTGIMLYPLYPASNY